MTDRSGLPTTVVHINGYDGSNSPYDVYVGRPSPWSNPFSHRVTKYKSIRLKDPEGKVYVVPVTLVETREEAVARYQEWLPLQAGLIASIPKYIKGRVLGCFCVEKRDADGNPLCHAVVLADLADGRWVP